jgi:chromosome segregation ATPase
MNIETLDLLAQKIEKALGTIRSLRQDNQKLQEHSLSLDSQVRLLEGQIAASRNHQEQMEAQLEEKSNEASNLAQELLRKEQDVMSARSEVDQRVIELNRLQESLREKEEKIQAAAGRLEQVMNSLEQELDVRVRAADEELLESGAELGDDRAFGDPRDLFGYTQR